MVYIYLLRLTEFHKNQENKIPFKKHKIQWSNKELYTKLNNQVEYS